MTAAPYRIVRFHQLGGPEVLRIEKATHRPLRTGEVRIQVLSLGMAQGDAMYREGTYLEQPKLPSGLGTEACGRIIEVGPNTPGWAIDDRVSVHSSHSKNDYPLYGEYAVLPVTSIVRAPAGMSDLEAGAFSLAYIPMYLALKREARVRAGETVVMNAAGATTSLAACQIARICGARPFGIVRTAEKAAMLASEGYEKVFVWDDHIVEQVKDATGGGADIVLDPVLGPGTERLSEFARWRARIVHYGALQGPVATHSIYQLAPKFLTVMGFTIYGYSGSAVMGIPRDEAAIAEAMGFIETGANTGAIRPRVCKVYGLDDIVAAHEDLRRGAHVGKIMVTP